MKSSFLPHTVIKKLETHMYIFKPIMYMYMHAYIYTPIYGCIFIHAYSLNPISSYVTQSEVEQLEQLSSRHTERGSTCGSQPEAPAAQQKMEDLVARRWGVLSCCIHTEVGAGGRD